MHASLILTAALFAAPPTAAHRRKRASRQGYMERNSTSPSARMGWLLAILSITFAGLVAYHFATAQRWFGLTLFGIVLPGSGLAGWYSLRQRGDDARRIADPMFVLFQVAMMSILVILENSEMREQEIQAEYEQRIEAPTEPPKGEQ